MLGQFLKVLGSDKIDCLVADREFIGAEWFAWLRANHIPFCIRIRHDMKVSRTTGALSPARNFFRSLPRATSCSLINARLVCGHWALGERYAPALRGLSDRGVESLGHQALEVYKRRWQIEVLFEALKSRGFNFEETRLKEAKRLETLCGVLAMAFCWAYHVGAWRHRVKPIALKACPSLNGGRIRDLRKACFAMDLTVFAKPSSMRQTREGSLIGSWICCGKRCHCPKRSFSLVTPHDFVVYSVFIQVFWPSLNGASLFDRL